jgi:uncharacterized protein YbbC (DUF1343 family)
MILFGIDRLLSEPELRKPFAGKRLGLLAHPASVTRDLRHSLDAIRSCPEFELTCAFGPQHGMRGEKQYNMVESEDYLDPVHGIPVFSLYGKTRRPTPEMLSHCDVVLVDLQDLGCRIYTYLTSLVYMMEACGPLGKKVVVLDRPNPAGRMTEGSILGTGNESFVGVGPVLMRHGLTLGEFAEFWKKEQKMSVDLEVIRMSGYRPDEGPGFGWPLEERAWVNPSPNAPTLAMARAYAGTVLLEGTHLSEGRGTTRPLEGFGAPDLDGTRILSEMARLAPDWLTGCRLRPFYFEPTFYKHQGKLCSGIQIHTDLSDYDPLGFRPYRILSLAFKAIRNLHPSYELWRDFPYEYVFDRLPIDVISGCETLRRWVDDPEGKPGDFDAFLRKDEARWRERTLDARFYS